ncbi:MAG: flippase-like domain-containing protein [Calditrichaeota bacterium]|nr:flippase-like domain-containing protein [Calditrichota bacterium]
MKKVVSNILRFLISFRVLGGLVYLIGLDRIIDNFRSVDPTLLLLAIGIFVVILVLMAFRWQILLVSQNHSPGYWKLLMFYFIGYFFNNFLPTAIGGDVSRAYYVGRANGNLPLSVGTVLFERILGVLATLTLATISMIWVAKELDPAIIFTTAMVFGIVMVSMIVLLNPALFSLCQRIFSKISIFSIGEKINSILESIHFYRNAKFAVLGGYLLSVTFQFLFVAMNYVLAQSLGLSQVTFIQLLLVIPITFVMGLLPSVNGLGVRESGYVVLLANVFHSATAGEAIALSLLNTSVPVLVSLAGGVMLLFYKHNNPAATADTPPVP